MKNILFRLGGLLMVAGAILPLFLPTVAPYIFALGALIFCPIQMTYRYEGDDFVVRRLRRQQLMGALLLLVTAGLMLLSLWGVPPFRGREWAITLMIATVLELYTAFRLPESEK